VFTGRRFHVLEQTASRSVELSSLLFVRVVTAGGISLMFGMTPYPMPAGHQLQMLDLRDRVFGSRPPTRRDLMAFDAEMRQLYLALAEELKNPTLPQLANTDGDPLEPTTLVYDLAAPVGAVFERLRPLAVVGDDEHISEVETDTSGGITSVVMDWVKAGNRTHPSWDNTILRTLRLAEGRLTAEVNSARRADRLERELKKRLGAMAKPRARSVDNLEKMLRDRAAARGKGGSATP
jgi:hypothetical protein